MAAPRPTKFPSISSSGLLADSSAERVRKAAKVPSLRRDAVLTARRPAEAAGEPSENMAIDMAPTAPSDIQNGEWQRLYESWFATAEPATQESIAPFVESLTQALLANPQVGDWNRLGFQLNQLDSLPVDTVFLDQASGLPYFTTFFPYYLAFKALSPGDKQAEYFKLASDFLLAIDVENRARLQAQQQQQDEDADKPIVYRSTSQLERLRALVDAARRAPVPESGAPSVFSILESQGENAEKLRAAYLLEMTAALNKPAEAEAAFKNWLQSEIEMACLLYRLGTAADKDIVVKRLRENRPKELKAPKASARKGAPVSAATPAVVDSGAVVQGDGIMELWEKEIGRPNVEGYEELRAAYGGRPGRTGASIEFSAGSDGVSVVTAPSSSTIGAAGPGASDIAPADDSVAAASEGVEIEL